MGIEILDGKILTDIRFLGDERIDFLCDDDTCYSAYHMQDCCEYVRIVAIRGNLQSIIGSPLITRQTIEYGDEYLNGTTEFDYWTRTIYNLKTDVGEVEIEWLGESNGFYSEDVYLGRTHTPIEMC